MNTNKYNATKVFDCLGGIGFKYIKDSISSIKARIKDGNEYITINYLKSYRAKDDNSIFRNKAVEMAERLSGKSFRTKLRALRDGEAESYLIGFWGVGL